MKVLKVQETLNQFKRFSELNQNELEQLRITMRRVNLLTEDSANSKTAKNSQFEAYSSYILHLSPYDIAYKYLGRNGNLCPMASQGCAAACLNTAGRGRFDSVKSARLRKTLYYILMRDDFMKHLDAELRRLDRKAAKAGKRLVVRLNGTSDIMWSLSLFESFPQVQFYDYTKIKRNAIRALDVSNYDVTFSASETNESDCLEMLQLGVNVAMVFDNIPTHYKTFKVINGDDHDLRFLDVKQGTIVGLKAKGKAKQDTSGFVRFVKQDQEKLAA